MREFKHLPKTYHNSTWFKMLAVFVLAVLMIKYHEQKPENTPLKQHIETAKETLQEYKDKFINDTQTKETKTAPQTDTITDIDINSHPLGQVINSYLLPRIQEKVDIKTAEHLSHNDNRKKIIDFVVGTGPKAICGQSATLHYEITTDTQNIIKTSKIKDAPPITITLGSNTAELSPYIQKEIIGMQAGGWRQISLPAYETFPKTSTLRDYTATNIELSKLSPPAPEALDQLQIFDKIPGKGDSIHCGQTATIHYTIKSVKNDILATSKSTVPIAVTLGQNHYMLGLEQGILGMRKSGIRTLIVPAALATHWNAPENKINLIPDTYHNNVIIDIELLSFQTL